MELSAGDYASIASVILEAYSRLKKVLNTENNPNVSDLIASFPPNFQNHRLYLDKWSSFVPLPLFENSDKTLDSTIELQITRDGNEEFSFTPEVVLLKDNGNVVIKGPPGAGKTTTLKRLIKHCIANEDNSEKPVLPILIELNKKDVKSISSEILKIFNLRTENIVEKEYYFEWINGKREEKERRFNIQYIGEFRLDDFMPLFLEAARIVVFIDGLDEVDATTQDSIQKEIENLGMKLDKSKIIITVRSYLKKVSINGFTTYKLQPLNEERVQKIAKKRLDKHELFLAELSQRKYKELANRPLFLSMLFVSFFENEQEYLNKEAYQVYEKAIRLINKYWDDSRGIKRGSKFDSFNLEEKTKFLSSIAFHVTYTHQLKSFDRQTLSNIYLEIHDSYSLPANEMDYVISEIEQHTGLINEIKTGQFQFSHSTLQEFLCADYISHSPISKKTLEYFYVYPDPLAILVAKEEQSNNWFCSLVLNENLKIGRLKGKKIEKKQYTDSLKKLIDRMVDEFPRFKIGKELGYAVLDIYFKIGHTEVSDSMINFLDIQNVKESLRLALNEFDIQSPKDNHVYLRRTKSSNSDFFVTLPDEGYLSNVIYNYV